MIHFTIHGDPQPWRRARRFKDRYFKDARTEAYEAAWANAAHVAMKGSPPLQGALQMRIIARFLAPKTLTKARRDAIAQGRERPTKRPDSDNIAKNMDGLNGVAFRDDAQVVTLMVSKVYAETAGVDVWIEEIG